MALTTAQKPLYAEDLQFMEAAGKLYPAIESVRNRPLDFGRRGGAAIGRAGDMYGSIYDAVGRARGQRDMAAAAREGQQANITRRKAALVQQKRAEALSSLLSAGYGAVQDKAAKGGWSLGDASPPPPPPPLRRWSPARHYTPNKLAPGGFTTSLLPSPGFAFVDAPRTEWTSPL